MNHLKSLFTLAIVASLTACTSSPPRGAGDISDAEAVSDTAPGINGDATGVEVIPANGGLSTDGGSMGQSLDGSSSDYPSDEMTMVDVAELYEPIIYFGYDQYELDNKNTEIVKFYAQEMMAIPSQKIVLKGHTDERGSPEYNLALGEKRAKTVAQAFMLFGIAQSRIDIVSFGEEQPAVAGSNENSWQKNRRVELIIR
ncbi:MAG: OmpA family protein [Pseudomonadota bacterium]